MREINGFVFVGYFTDFSQVFGRAVNDVARGYEPLGANGIVPYDLLLKAQKGAYLIGQRKIKDFREAKVGELEMNIANSEDDLVRLRTEDSLIVVSDFGETKDFLGPKVVNEAEVLGEASPLGLNGFRTFRSDASLSSYEKVGHLFTKMKRYESNPRATVATFKLNLEE